MTFVEERSPAVADPHWAKWAAPLRAFLAQTPRDWRAIETWCQSTGAMSVDRCRQCIAWLEQQHVAYSMAADDDGRVLWIARAA